MKRARGDAFGDVDGDVAAVAGVGCAGISRARDTLAGLNDAGAT